MYLLLSVAGGKDKDMYFNQLEFGKRLQECRKLKELTQEELEELVGVEKQHISRIERGVTACSIDLLPVLSVTLQVSTDYLLMGKSIDKEITRTQLLSVISQLTLITQGL
jgi:transcriptional regulator with XRE-family HTH domain